MAENESGEPDEPNPRVTTVLPGGQEQMDEWDQYVEEHSEVSSMSHLIRLSVEKEMNGHHEPAQGGQSGMSEDVAGKLAEVIEHNQEVMNRLENLQKRVRNVENAIEGEPELEELKNDVFAVLPTPDKVEAFEDFPGDFTEYAREVEGAVTREGDVDFTELSTVASGRPEDIARALDEREGIVEKALEKLPEDTARVRQNDDGRWVKEV